MIRMRSVIVMNRLYRFAAHGASTVDRPAKSFQRSGPCPTHLSRTIHLAVLALLIPVAAALADDRLSPRGIPWWRELAQCGGLALALRDRAIDLREPPERIAGITRDMNG